MKLDLAKLKVDIEGYAIGKEIRSFRIISSTQDYAISIAERDPYCHGMVIVSESQLLGRGRNGKKWLSPFGGLWFSVIIKSDLKSSSSIFLSYAMSLAVCETITNNFNIEAVIKWPNDILIKLEKVAGILLSSSIQGNDLEYSIVGVGVNLNSRPKGVKGSTSVAEHITRTPIALEPFLANILVLFNNYYNEIRSGNWEAVTERWKLHCPMIGKWMKVRVGGIQFEGLANNIDSDGLLALVTAAGKKVKISDVEDVSIKTTS